MDLHDTGAAARLEQLARSIAQESLSLSKAVGKRGDEIRATRQLFKVGALLIGVGALITSHPAQPTFSFPQWIVVLFDYLSALVLVFGSTYLIFAEQDPPERYRDWVIYLLHAAKRIETVLGSEDITQDLGRGRLLELVDYANLQINDIRSLWPWLSKSVPNRASYDQS